MTPEIFTFLLTMICCAIFAVMGYKLGFLYGWDQGMKDCSKIWERSKSETLAEAERQARVVKAAFDAAGALKSIRGGKTDKEKDA